MGSRGDAPSPASGGLGDPTVADTSATRATSIVALGMMTMNVLMYAFTLLAAHLLGPTDFGAVSALLGILIVANVGALALQATAARRLATSDDVHRAGVTRDIRRTAAAGACALGIVLLLASPVINAALHLDDLVSASMVGLTVVPLTLTGAFAGVVQGQRRWAELATVYLCTGLGRIVAGGTALLVSPTLRGAMVGIAIGSLAPAIVGGWLTRTPDAQAGGHQPVVRELWRNGHTLLAFFVFTNIDVLLARHLFSHHDAGIYAAGVILSKTCLFLPTFVLVAAFPSMAADRAGRVWVKVLAAVAVLGLVAIVGTWLLPDLAVTFAGGGEYSDLADIAWLFALEGTVFAMLQILVYESIASQAHAAVVLWSGAAVVTVVALTVVDTVTGLVIAVCLTAAVATVVTWRWGGRALVTGLVPGAAETD